MWLAERTQRPGPRRPCATRARDDGEKLAEGEDHDGTTVETDRCSQRVLADRGDGSAHLEGAGEEGAARDTSTLEILGIW